MQISEQNRNPTKLKKMLFSFIHKAGLLEILLKGLVVANQI